MSTLTELATTIRTEHDLAYQSAIDTLEHAIKCGEALYAAREAVVEGEWGTWIAHNTSLTVKMAGSYIRIATYRDVLLDAEHRPKSLTAAMQFLRDVEAPPVVSVDRDKKPNQRRRQKKAEQRAIASQQVVAEVVQAGGSLANSYLLLRQCGAELEQAITNAETATLRKTLEDALSHTHSAERAILRALGIEHRRS